MKLFKAMICFFVLILSLFGAITIYGQQNQTQWIDKFIESFEMTESNFKFYNIKSSIIIEKEMDRNQLKDICTEIAKNLGDGHGELSSKMQKGEIYVNYDDEDKGISIVGVKKNSKEFYIIVDILNNKVYKNIRDIYQTLNKVLNSHSNDVEIAMCIVGEYTKNLQLYKFNDILKNILVHIELMRSLMILLMMIYQLQQVLLSIKLV